MTSHHNGGSKLPNVNGWNAVKPRHSIGYRVQHRLRFTLASIVAAAIVFAGTIAAAVWADFGNAVGRGTTKVIGHTAELVDPNAGKPISFLLLGQDTRNGAGNSAIGGAAVGSLANSHNSDTAMVVQVSADRSYINVVSIPRDSLVNAPSCQTSKGTIPAQYNVMFNSIFSSGWSQGGDLASAASCSLTAVNALTGLNLSNFVVVDFAGLKNMIDALGGVSLCIPVNTTDYNTGLNLKKGFQHLDGTTATQYARMREGTGTDGSDIMRTTRQQYLIKQLLNEAKRKNLFTATAELYQLAKAAIQSLNISTGLASTTTLAGLAMSLKNINTSNVYMRTVPVTQAPSDPNRVVWTAAAAAVWQKMRNNVPLTDQAPKPASSSPSASSSSSHSSSTSSPSATASPSSSSSAPATATINPTTGLIKQADGTLIDPNTGGIVDPTNGAIRDPNTGQYIGTADKYLNVVICGVPTQE